MKHTQNITLAIDPGYGRLGWAIGVIKNKKVTTLAYGCIETNAKKELYVRYQEITTQLTQICTQYEPTELAIETLFFSKNTATALKVAEARGLIFASCLPFVTQVFEYNPGSIKVAVTGHGSANKAAVKKMTLLQTDLASVHSNTLDDTIDALAILITHAVSR